MISKRVGHGHHRRLQPLPLSAVCIDDPFWSPRRRVNREVTLNYQLEQCEETGRLDNFDKAAGRLEGKFEGIFFNDSDIYKWVEATAYSLATNADPAREESLDRVIDRIAAAQQADGYLNTYFQLEEPEKKWTHLGFLHELYCAGHLFQAAVAHHQATQKRTLLDVAFKLADHIDREFGPGKRPGIPGHEEIELALVDLYRVSGEARYLKLAKFFVDQRGQQPSVLALEIAESTNGEGWHDYYHQRVLRDGKYDGRYAQDHAPVRDQDEAVGHAVRATYLYSAMADLVGETGDTALRETLERLWNNVTHRRMYVTGGIGPCHDNEGFTRDYDLPNTTAYAETCAAAGNIFWNHRMLLLDGDPRFADVMERSLYNGLLSGVSLDGRQFFYVNPLRTHGDHDRQPWFGCACCPPNIARLLASLGQYIYAQSDDGLWVHLYVGGHVSTTTPGGQPFRLSQASDYPWQGDITFEVELDRPEAFALYLRIPDWCPSATLSINRDTAAGGLPQPGTYHRLERTWQNGDTVVLKLAMPLIRVRAHPAASNNVGHVALQRGPIVYCLEEVDHPVSVHALQLPQASEIEATFRPDLLGGVCVLQGEAQCADPTAWQNGLYLYRDAGMNRPVPLRAVPYFSWNNRGPGAMTVWVKTA